MFRVLYISAHAAAGLIKGCASYCSYGADDFCRLADTAYPARFRTCACLIALQKKIIAVDRITFTVYIKIKLINRYPED